MAPENDGVSDDIDGHVTVRRALIDANQLYLFSCKGSNQHKSEDKTDKDKP